MCGFSNKRLHISALGVTIIIVGLGSLREVQLQDEADCVSLRKKALVKTMNSSFLHLAIDT